ncbi:MAG: glutamate--tRNA ligase family protein [bacterium]|nr:glutamate--tRNA ligase family protein [bacterium]
MNDHTAIFVRTRFAPSPTGVLHIGGLRTALFNYLYAKKYGGECVLRIDDTDTLRSKKEYEVDILDSLQLAGITFDATYHQSERHEIYRSYLITLIETNQAYLSKEEDSDGKRSEVIRFKNPNKVITFDDTIRGTISVDTTDLGDFVIAKSIDEPLYHLASVIDDFEMGITHVIRGEEHISNTPRQILIQESINAPRPQYAHLPLILATDRSKLSKRHGAVSTTEYIREGFLPGALVNYIALLGWSPQVKGGADASDILSIDTLTTQFDLTDMQKGGAVFTIEKLKSINQHYIKELPPVVLAEKIRHWLPENYSSKISDEYLNKLAPIILERIATFGELSELFTAGEFDYYLTPPAYQKELLLGKKGELDPTHTKEHLQELRGRIERIGEWTMEGIRTAVWDYAEEKGKAAVLWPLRVSLSGKERSTDPFTIAYIVGKEATLGRIKTAMMLLA